jgi:hypothetical protein
MTPQIILIYFTLPSQKPKCPMEKNEACTKTNNLNFEHVQVKKKKKKKTQINLYNLSMTRMTMYHYNYNTCMVQHHIVI